METVSLRELSRDAARLVARAGAGEEIRVAVDGRHVASLVATSGPTPWRTWDAIAGVFDGPEELTWHDDRDRVDQELHDPRA